jgi:hypothetical protein
MSDIEMAAWLRRTIKYDLLTANLISAGGFAPQLWDTEPRGQVNPADVPQSDAVTAALGCAPEYICGWVQLVAYDKMNNEPDERYGRDSEAPFALIDNGRAQVEHVIRNDPRNAVARLEAELAILDLYAATLAITQKPPVMPEGHPAAGMISARDYLDAKRELAVLEPVVRLLASGYKHRPGYQEEWSA